MRKCLLVLLAATFFAATNSVSAQMQKPKNFQSLQAGYWQQTIRLQSGKSMREPKTEFRCMSAPSIPGFMSSEQAKTCSLQVLEDSKKVWKLQSMCPQGLQTMFKLEMISPLQAAIQIDSVSPKGRSTASGQLKFLGSCPQSAMPTQVDTGKLGKLNPEQCRLLGIQFEAMAPDKAAVTCGKHEAKLRQACLIRAARSYKNLDTVLKSDACQ